LPRFGKVYQQIEADGYAITSKVYTTVEGEIPVVQAQSTGLAITELASTFDRLKPDWVVTVADRYETLATAIAASYLNIPLCHVQGGEVTGNIDEKVRHAVSKLADMHCVSTATSWQRLCRMGERPDRIFNTGCPSIDLVKEAVQTELTALPGGMGPKIRLSERFLVVLLHPTTTEYQEAQAQTEAVLKAVVASRLPAFWFRPNPDAGSGGVAKALQDFHEQHPGAPINFRNNIPPEDMVRLLARAACIVGNSSVAIRECSYLGTPALDLGTRQSGREHGPNVMRCDFRPNNIRDAIGRQVSHGPYRRSIMYGDGNAGPRIAALLATEPRTFTKRLEY